MQRRPGVQSVAGNIIDAVMLSLWLSNTLTLLVLVC